MRTDTIYSKYRSLSREAAKRKLLWELRGGVGALASFTYRIFLLALAIAALATVLSLIEDISAAEDRVHAKVQRLEHLEKTIVSCLNHKGIFINDELHICTLANTHIQKGDNL